MEFWSILNKKGIERGNRMTGMRIKFKRMPLVLLTLGLLLLGTVFIAQRETSYDQLRLFSEVLSKVESGYAEEVDSKTLIQAAIDGMLGSLDPHSQLMEPEEHLDLMISTKGRFGGLGIQIAIRDEILTVISPLEGTPAYRLGIQPGDRIVEIEGESTTGISLREAVKKLRGEPGTKVTITIERTGYVDPFSLTITREIIEVDAIPYYGKVAPDIGYIRLADFSDKCGEEVREAVLSLREQGSKKFILDLRNNHGGLLKEALEVSEVFMKKGSLVVSTEGRIQKSTKKYTTEKNGASIEDPLVILVNRGSASASEIVSGAIQDWDRGVILGDTTFGKGTVQTVMELTDRTYYLKLTTAYWYLPSARSIDADLIKKKKKETRNETVGPEASVHPTVGELHREVPTGGGIIPDLEVRNPEPTPFANRLDTDQKIRDLFYRFAKEYIGEGREVSRDFKELEAMVEGFKGRLREKGVEYDEKEFEEARDTVRRILKQQVAELQWGTKGVYEVLLKEDPQVKEAVRLLERAKNTKDLFRLVAMN